MKSFVGHIINKVVKSTPRSKKVSPTIKSVKPNLKQTVKETKKDLELKTFLKVDKLRQQKSEGMKAARKAQRELQRAAETKRATKISSQYFGRSVPARSSDLANPTEVKTKKFKKGKEIEREKKMGGGMMGRRFGMKQGTPKPKSNVQKIKETFAPKGLKKIDPQKQKGLAKLKKERPDVVRKMGYMKRGGRAGFKDGTGPEQFMREGKEDPMRDRMKQPLKRTKEVLEKIKAAPPKITLGKPLPEKTIKNTKDPKRKIGSNVYRRKP